MSSCSSKEVLQRYSSASHLAGAAGAIGGAIVVAVAAYPLQVR